MASSLMRITSKMFTLASAVWHDLGPGYHPLCCSHTALLTVSQTCNPSPILLCSLCSFCLEHSSPDTCMVHSSLQIVFCSNITPWERVALIILPLKNRTWTSQPCMLYLYSTLYFSSKHHHYLMMHHFLFLMVYWLSLSPTKTLEGLFKRSCSWLYLPFLKGPSTTW